LEALPKNLEERRLVAITIYDIAREAEVGIGTVSRVFNNHPNVSRGTRDKVLSIAKRLNYHPHAYAQGLARKRTNTLSAIIPYFTNYFFIEVLQSVQDKLAAVGYDLILYGINHTQQLEEYLKRSLQRGRVDGILFFSMTLPEEYADRFRETKTPIVLVDTFNEQFDTITVENFQGATIATQHLISLGHKNIGMINANLNSVPARKRLRGFSETLEKNGLDFREEFVVNSTMQKLDGFSREAGYTAMKEILQRHIDLPSAFFVSSDIQAIGAMSALNETGLKVPTNISIVSFDDIELAKHFELTTMRQPMREMGELAVTKILARMEDPTAPVSHQRFLPKLVVRNSCGFTPAQHRVRLGLQKIEIEESKP
jgi:LacI family transcriptional regulator, galactose operon repressor